MAVCCVPLCKSRKSRGSGISFHELPSNPILRQKWISSISEMILTASHMNDYQFYQPSIGAMVCGHHFTKDSYENTQKRKRLKVGAIPTLFGDSTSSRMPNIEIAEDQSVSTHWSELNTDELTGCEIVEIATGSTLSDSLFSNTAQEQMPLNNQCIPDGISLRELSMHIASLDHDYSMKCEQSNETAGQNQLQPNELSTDVQMDSTPCTDPVTPSTNNTVEVATENDAVEKSVSLDHSYNRDGAQDPYLTMSAGDEAVSSTDAGVQVQVLIRRREKTRRAMQNLASKLSGTRKAVKRLRLRNKALKMELRKFRIFKKLLKDAEDGDLKARMVMEQCKAYGKKKHNWPEDLLHHYVMCYCKSSNLYRLLRKHYMNLPAISSLKRYVGFSTEGASIQESSSSIQQASGS